MLFIVSANGFEAAAGDDDDDVAIVFKLELEGAACDNEVAIFLLNAGTVEKTLGVVLFVIEDDVEVDVVVAALDVVAVTALLLLLLLFELFVFVLSVSQH